MTRFRSCSGSSRALRCALLLWLGGTDPARAETLTGAQLVERWTEAIGGAEALRSTDSLYVRSDFEFSGLKGTVEDWTTARGEHRSEVKLGGFTELVVFDGAGGWVRDQNGQLQRLADTRLEDEATIAAFGSFSHLLPGRRPVKLQALKGEGPPQLQIVPEGGGAGSWSTPARAR